MHARHIATPLNPHLALTQFTSQGKAHGVVLIGSAIAVPQSYYSALAQWLSGQGYHVLTFDYSGTFASLRSSMKQVQVDVLDWAHNDGAAVVAEAVKCFPDLPVYWIGHSMGGQLVGLLPNVDKIAKVITIACGSGYWRENAIGLKRRVWVLWYFAVPLLTPIFGYFPGKKLNMMGDLPRRVIWQWRRWCLHPEYMFGVEGDAVRQQYARVRVPLTSLSFSDDEYMSWTNTQRLHQYYSHARTSMQRIAPKDAGVVQIGHFGFFKPKFQNSLWQQQLLPELTI